MLVCLVALDWASNKGKLHPLFASIIIFHVSKSCEDFKSFVLLLVLPRKSSGEIKTLRKKSIESFI